MITFFLINNKSADNIEITLIKSIKRKIKQSISLCLSSSFLRYGLFCLIFKIN
jgi:hypothetical protein